MAIASRETNMHNVVGDGGHGYGIMQIDDRNFPEGLWFYYDLSRIGNPDLHTTGRNYSTDTLR